MKRPRIEHFLGEYKVSKRDRYEPQPLGSGPNNPLADARGSQRIPCDNLENALIPIQMSSPKVHSVASIGDTTARQTLDAQEKYTRRITRRGDHRQRGSVYVMILLTSMIVTTIGLTALLAGRLQHRTSAGTSDFTEARLYAMSAVDMGLLLIRQNSTTWRTLFATGGLPTDQPIGRGTMTLQAVDPIDADIASGAEPVVLTGIGKVGQAVYKLQAQLNTSGKLTPGTLRRVVD